MSQQPTSPKHHLQICPLSLYTSQITTWGKCLFESLWLEKLEAQKQRRKKTTLGAKRLGPIQTSPCVMRSLKYSNFTHFIGGANPTLFYCVVTITSKIIVVIAVQSGPTNVNTAFEIKSFWFNELCIHSRAEPMWTPYDCQPSNAYMFYFWFTYGQPWQPGPYSQTLVEQNVLRNPMAG